MLLAATAWADEPYTGPGAPGTPIDDPRLERDEPPDVVPEGPLHRDPTGFGLGAILGLPTGFTMAYRGPTSPLTLDFAAAWPAQPALQVHANVTWTYATFAPRDLRDLSVPAYLGAGARVRVATPRTALPVELGLRMPLGLFLRHRKAPIEGFAELVPVAVVIPVPAFHVDAAVGARFFLEVRRQVP
jgi:hypothetical protein